MHIHDCNPFPPVCFQLLMWSLPGSFLTGIGLSCRSWRSPSPSSIPTSAVLFAVASSSTPPPSQSASTHVSDERHLLGQLSELLKLRLCMLFTHNPYGIKCSMSMCNAEQLEIQMLQIRESNFHSLQISPQLNQVQLTCRNKYWCCLR